MNTITTDGTKLPPFLIFKAKVNGDIEKALSKEPKKIIKVGMPKIGKNPAPEQA